MSQTPFAQSLQRLEDRHGVNPTRANLSADSSVSVMELLGDRSGANPTDRSFISVAVKCALMPDDVSLLGGREMAEKAIQEFTDAWTSKYRADVFAFIAAQKRAVASLPDDLVGSVEEKLAAHGTSRGDGGQ